MTRLTLVEALVLREQMRADVNLCYALIKKQMMPINFSSHAKRVEERLDRLQRHIDGLGG